METVQLSLGDTRYAAQLRDLLASGGSREVRCVETPDAAQDGVIVVDPDGLNRLPSPLNRPERVVLITHNDPRRLSEAWNAGIRSVIFAEEPLTTAVLAIMAASLRVPKPEPHWTLSHPRIGATGPCSACEVRTNCGAGTPEPKERRGQR